MLPFHPRAVGGCIETFFHLCFVLLPLGPCFRSWNTDWAGLAACAAWPTHDARLGGPRPAGRRGRALPQSVGGDRRGRGNNDNNTGECTHADAATLYLLVYLRFVLCTLYQQLGARVADAAT